MISKVGLLPPRNVEQVPFAYKVFKESGPENDYRRKNYEDPRGWYSRNFTRTFSREVDVEFLGIWDTVSSVGFFPRYLPHTSTNSRVKHVRHAIALDETRTKFKATYWNPWRDEGTAGKNQEERDKGKKNEERASSRKNFKSYKQTVEEVWFAGGHGDVGGGWEAYLKKDQLARIPFRWMVRQAQKCVPDILWNQDSLKEHDVLQPDLTDSDALKKYLERETQDAAADFHSAFLCGKVWFLWVFLELIPLVGMVRFLGHSFRFLQLPHFWAPRNVRPGEPVTKVHSSVWTRVHYDPKGYKISVKMDPSKTEFVDGWALPTTDRQGKPLPPPPGKLVL
ncbi:hypothetical protein FS837_006178 [Tulasnella sp. UAMH 9824]|nr:hypothetical protein FS837_006178 [Tulasnella sp. UAMH 9824]